MIIIYPLGVYVKYPPGVFFKPERTGAAGPVCSQIWGFVKVLADIPLPVYTLFPFLYGKSAKIPTGKRLLIV